MSATATIARPSFGSVATRPRPTARPLTVTAHRSVSGPRSSASWQRSSAPRASVLVRRRVVAALIVALVLVGGGVRAVAAVGAGPASSTDRRPAVHVVQPGDTVWSIVRAYKPTGDIRALVRQLTTLNGGADLEVGQQFVLSS